MRIRDERISSLTALVVASAAASFLSGCAYLSHTQESPQYTAVPAMKRAQTLNPDAGRYPKVVAGLDSKAAANVGEGYAKTFEKKQATKQATETFAGLTGLSN